MCFVLGRTFVQSFRQWIAVQIAIRQFVPHARTARTPRCNTEPNADTDTDTDEQGQCQGEVDPLNGIDQCAKLDLARRFVCLAAHWISTSVYHSVSWTIRRSCGWTVGQVDNWSNSKAFSRAWNIWKTHTAGCLAGLAAGPGHAMPGYMPSGREGGGGRQQ